MYGLCIITYCTCSGKPALKSTEKEPELPWFCYNVGTTITNHPFGNNKSSPSHHHFLVGGFSTIPKWVVYCCFTHTQNYPLPGHDGIYGDWIFAATGGWQKQKTSAAHGSSTMPSSTQAVSVRYSFVHLQFRDCQWKIISEFPCFCLWNSNSGCFDSSCGHIPHVPWVNVWEFQIQVPPPIDGLVLLDSFSGSPWWFTTINKSWGGSKKEKVRFKENSVENPWGL